MKQPFGENLIGGDTWRWNVALEDLGISAAPDATLKYFFRTSGGQKLTIDAQVSADGTFQFLANPDATLTLVGSCVWQLCIFDADSNRTELARGSVTVLADIASAGDGFDGRSWTKRMLDAVEAVLENRASRVEREYQIGGRHVGLLEPSELLKLKGDLRAAYNRELIASGQRPSNSNQIRVGFGPRRTRTGVWR